jgi:hypothetical protein
MSTSPAFDHASLRRSFKSIRNPSPLLEAMLEWYNGLDEVDQYETEQTVMNIIHRIKYGTGQPFGPAAALELMGCLIAVECEWISPSLPRRMYTKNGHQGT